MKKKQLLQIRPKEPSEDLLQTAKNDRYCERLIMRKQWSYAKGGCYDFADKIKSFSTALYFTAQKENEILAVSAYSRMTLAAGCNTPLFTTFIDLDNEKWITHIGAKWSEAYTANTIRDIKEGNILQKTSSEIAVDMFDKEDLDLCNEALGVNKSSIMLAVDAWQDYARGKDNELKGKKRIEKWNRQMAMLPDLPDDFEKWAEYDATAQSNFLFYKRKGDKTEAFCTHCGNTFTTTQKMRHTKGEPGHYAYRAEDKYFCPHCNTWLAAKAWKKQKELRTTDYLLIAQKAGPYIAFRKFRITKRFGYEDFTEKWKTWKGMTETLRVFADPHTFQSIESYTERVVDIHGKVMWAETKEGGYYGLPDKRPYESGTGIAYLKNIDEVLEGTSVRPVVAKMFFERKNESLQFNLQVASKKGYLEYMAKAGLKNLMRQAIRGHDVKNKKAKDLKGLLGLNGQQLRKLKDLDGNFYMIDAMRYVEKKGEKINDEALRLISNIEIAVENLPMERTGMSLQRMINYICRQSNEGCGSFRETVTMYKDYLRLAQERGMDIKDEIVCHTPRLREMHDRYVEEKNAKKNAAEEARVNKMFAAIAKDFERNKEHFEYEKEGLVIVVPERANDIKIEGRLQHHCVGASDTYMKRMNKRESFIVFLRKKEEPMVPYYTIETDYDGNILQSYSAYDRKPDWEKVEPVLKGFTRLIAKRAEKEAALIAAG